MMASENKLDKKRILIILLACLLAKRQFSFQSSLALSMTAPSKLHLFILLLGIFLLGLTDVQIISPILPALAEAFSVNAATVGVAVSAYAITAALWALVVGPLSDQFGRLIFLRIAAWVFSGAAIMAYWAAQFEHFVFARVFAGLAGGTISACVIAQAADLFEYELRGRAMGWLSAAYFLAAVIAAPLGAWITSLWGWRILYLLLAMPAILLGIFLRPKMLPLPIQNSPQSNLVGLPKAASNFSVTTLARQIQNYSRYFSRKAPFLGLLLALSISAAVASVVTYLGLWLASDFAMSISTIGLVFMVTGGASVAGALSGGWFADWLGKRRMIAFSSAILAIILFFIGFVQTRFGVFLFCAAGGLAMALREGPFQALISELVPAAERGAYIALRNAASQVAIAAAAATCGLLFEHFGFHAVAYFSAGCSVLAGGIALQIVEPSSHT
jgi:predicted MFS family arabinose efflux permease